MKMEGEDDASVWVEFQDSRSIVLDEFAEILTIKRQNPKEQAVEQWLQPTAYDDPAGEYSKHLMSHVHGTGDWLLETAEYRQWHDSTKGRCLWIKAPPGAGKSVIAARLRSDIASKEPDVPAAYFFFRHIIASNRHPSHLVRDWLAQLMQFEPSICDQIHETIVEKRKSLDAVAFAELWDVLSHAVQQMPKSYLFVDALDEMEQTDPGFLSKLVQLTEYSGCKLFITSRPTPAIVQALRGKDLQLIDLSRIDLDQDIGIYVDGRLESDIGRYIETRLAMSHLAVHGESSKKVQAHELIRDTLQRKAQGSFLYARLTMDTLFEAFRDNDGLVDWKRMQQLLDEAPTGLSEMYDNMLQEHARRSGVSTDLQLLILQWVTQSRRPLRILELASIVDHVATEPSKLKDSKAVVRAACGPLLEILPSDVVGPVHHSFTEWLTTPHIEKGRKFPCIDSQLVHRKISETCLTYLLNIYENNPAVTETPMLRMKVEHAFLDYALNNWHHHASSCDPTDVLFFDLLNVFVSANSSACLAWKSFQMLGTLHDSFTGLDERQTSRHRYVEPLHIAAYLGLSNYMRHLLGKGGLDVNSCGTSDKQSDRLYRASPLHMAAKTGKDAAVKILIDHGATVDQPDSVGMSPLHIAAQHNSTAAAAVLLEAGMSPTCLKIEGPDDQRKRTDIGFAPGRRNLGETPLSFACQSGKSETLRLFIPFLTQKDLADALGDAIRLARTDLEAVSLLLDGDKSLANSISRGQTPLYAAAMRAHLPCMRLLIKHGADATATSCPDLDLDQQSLLPYRSRAMKRTFSTPLHALIQGMPFHHEAIAEGLQQRITEAIDVLIAVGCPIDAEDGQNNTGLVYAQPTGWLVSHLVKHGASVQKLIDRGSLPLHAIAGTRKFDKEHFAFWLGHGVPIDSKDASGRTPLLVYIAANLYNRDESCQDDIEWLMSHKPDIAATDNEGNNALYLTLQDQSNHWLAQRLMNDGIDHKSTNLLGNTAAHRGPTAGLNLNLIPFADLGLDLEARNNLGRTAFLDNLPLIVGRDGIDRSSELSSRVNVHAVDDAGANALHLAIQAGRDGDCLQHYIKLGLDPEARDHAGNTIWHYYFMRYQKLDLDKLAEWAKPDRSNHIGQTPLHIATVLDRHLADLLLLPNLGGIDINAGDSFGVAAIHLAATMCMRTVIQLQSFGADLWLRTNSGQTVLHFAVQARQPDILAYLTDCALTSDRNDLINAVDESGATALTYAARSGNFDLVKILLDIGACLPCNLDHAHAACRDFSQETSQWLETRNFDADDRKRFSSMLSETFSILQDFEFSSQARRLGSLSRDMEEFKSMQRHILLEQAESNQRERQRYRNLKDRFPSVSRCLRLLEDAQPQLRNVMQDPSVIEPPAETLTGLTNLDHAHPIKFSEAQSRMKAAGLSEAEGIENTSGVLQTLLRARMEDSAELMLDTLICDESVREQPQLAINLLGVLIKHGKPEMLHRFVVRLEDFVQHEHAEGWPEMFKTVNLHASTYCSPAKARSSFISIGDNRDGKVDPYDGAWRLLWGYERPSWYAHEDSLFQPDSKFSKNPFIWVFLEACQASSWPNTYAIRVLVESRQLSEHEVFLALFRLSMAENFWQVVCFRYLITKISNVNATNPIGATLLHAACRANSESLFSSAIVKILLQHGADPNLVDAQGGTCLSKAAWNTEILQLLLDHGAQLELGKPRCLMRVLKAQNLSGLKLLLNKNVDIHRRATDHRTAAQQNLSRSKMDEHWAESKSTATRYRTGPDPYNDDEDYLLCSYPLHLAAQKKYPNWAASSRAFQRERVAIIAALLDAGANPMALLDNGSPLLVEMMARGAYFDPLLKSPGLDITKRDVAGRNMLLALVSKPGITESNMFGLVIEEEKKDDQALERRFNALIDLGIDIKAVDYRGKHILHYVTSSWHSSYNETAEMLLNQLLARHDARELINQADVDGWLPIHNLLKRKAWRLAKLLIDAGATVLPDPEGSSLLHHLADVEGQVSPKEFANGGEMTTAIEAELGYISSLAIDVDARNQEGATALLTYLKTCPSKTSTMRSHGYVRGLASLISSTERRLDRNLKSLRTIDAICSLNDSEKAQYRKSISEIGAFRRGIDFFVQTLGADPLRHSGDGQSALHVLATCTPRHQQHKSASNIFEEPDDKGVLLDAWHYFVNAGLDPREEDAHKATPLDIAALNGNHVLLDLYKL